MQQWQAIDDHEVAEGRRTERPRVKIVDVADMLAIASVAPMAT